jgi:hypothetical protein
MDHICVDGTMIICWERELAVGSIGGDWFATQTLCYRWQARFSTLSYSNRWKCCRPIIIYHQMTIPAGITIKMQISTDARAKIAIIFINVVLYYNNLLHQPKNRQPLLQNKRCNMKNGNMNIRKLKKQFTFTHSTFCV